MDLMGLLSMLHMFNKPTGLTGLNWQEGGPLQQGVGGGILSPGSNNPWGGGNVSTPQWYNDPYKLMMLSGMFGNRKQDRQPPQSTPMSMSQNPPPDLGGLFQPRQRHLGLQQLDRGGY